MTLDDLQQQEHPDLQQAQPDLQAPPGPPTPPPETPPVKTPAVDANASGITSTATPKLPDELAAIAKDYIPLQPENPDSESSTKLINSYNQYRLNGGKNEDLPYEDMQNILSVAKGLSMHTDKMEVLQNPDLFFNQVYKAGKAPVMFDDVINEAIKNPASIMGDISSAGQMAQQLVTAGALGIGDVVKDTFTSLNPFVSQADRDAASARNQNALLRGVKGGITMWPDMAAGLQETFRYDALKNQLDQTTDPAQRDQIEHQISEQLRQGELRAALNEKSNNNAHEDFKAILNATGISAALKGLGLPDRTKILGTDEAQPSQGQQMLYSLISPVDAAGAVLGDSAGAIKSAIRFQGYDKAAAALSDAQKVDAGLQAQRVSITNAIANTTDDAAKAGLNSQLSDLAAQEKAHAPILAQAQSDVNTLGANITKQMNEMAPGLSQPQGNLATQALVTGLPPGQGITLGTGAFAGAMDGLANLIELPGKITNSITERVLGPNATEGAKEGVARTLDWMADKGKDLIGVHVLEGALGAAGGYAGVQLIKPLVNLMTNPDALRGIARDARVIGEQYALGHATLPALQQLDGKLSGLSATAASFLDNPTVRAVPAMFAGGLKGSVVGGAMGALASGGTAAGFGQGALQGGLFGTAGAGHGQVRSFNSPGELRVAQIGDRARFVNSLGTDPVQRALFNQLHPDTQLAIGTYAHAHPDLGVSFINDPTTSQGQYHPNIGDKAHAVINVAATNPLDSVLMHEISHHVAQHGLTDTINDNILGNPATGHIGLFTHLDANGKPVEITSTDPLSGAETRSYMPNDDFNRIKSDYNARKLRDFPGEQPEDNYGIAQEIHAELNASLFTDPKAVQKLIRGGALPSDLVNQSAIGNFLSKLGLPADSRTGSLIADPEGIKNVQGLADITANYLKTKAYKNHPLEFEDGYSRVTPDMWHKNPDILLRNLDGAGIMKRDPKTGDVVRDLAGQPVLLSKKEVDAEHAKFTGEVVKILKANPRLLDPTPDGNGLRLVTDRDGHQVYRGQNVPDEVFAKMAETNQYNPYQLQNWRTINELTRRDDGSVMQANYNTARGSGGRYTTVEMKERALVPMYFEISPQTGQVNTMAYDPGTMLKNATTMLRRKDAATQWGSIGDAVKDIHTYLENLAALRPGETGIGLQKKQIINAMFGIRGGANPYIETLTKQIPSVFKTFRLDRTNKAVEVAGANRPIRGATYEDVRSFLMPRALSPEEQAARDASLANTQPVTMRTMPSGKQQPVEIDYGLSHTPLVGDKAPPTKPEKGAENNFGHVDFLTKPEQQKLTHLDNASAVTDYADKLVGEYDKWKGDPRVMDAKGWYGTVLKYLKKGFGGDKQLFAELLSATSPQTGVVQNFDQALEAYRLFRAGKYDDAIREYKRTGKITPDMKPTKSNGKLYGFNSDAVLKVLAGSWLDNVEGPKTPNFFRNLFQHGTDATIDMWAARTMHRLGNEGVEGAPAQWRIQPASETGVNNLDFALSQQAFRQAADKIGIKPHELQAILWYGEKVHYANQGYTKGGASAALASFIPQLKAYAAAPEFKPGAIDTRGVAAPP